MGDEEERRRNKNRETVVNVEDRESDGNERNFFLKQ